MVVTQDLLKEYLEYREDGHLYWIKKKSRNTVLNSRFGCLKDGYVMGGFNHKMLREHRLVWLYHYGVWPKDQLDHINGIRDDNRVENLRETTNQQNSFNTKSRNNSSSKYKGVKWHTIANKWSAQYVFNGKEYYLGLFIEEKDAAKAYDEATKPIHQSFHKENSYDR